MQDLANYQNAQSFHAKKRAAERYNFELDNNALSDIRKRLCTGHHTACRLFVQPDGKEVFAVWYGGEWIPVVFDPWTQRIVTFLPPEMIRMNRHKLPW